MPGALRRSKSHLLVALGLSLGVACKAAPTRPVVSAIDLRESNDERVVDDSAVLDGLATYDEYDPSVLARDLERIERYYRARGFYEAKVTAARVLLLDGKHVRIEIRVVPGPPVVVRSIHLPAPFEVSTKLTKARHVLEAGNVFDEARFDELKHGLQQVLHDEGYPFAKVDAKAHIDLVSHTADIEGVVEPGSAARYGALKVEGLKAISETIVRDTLGIEEGEPYSQSELSQARQALLNLGVFSNVEIREDLSHPESNRVPLAVVVSETQLRSVRVGGGAEFDVLRLNLHLTTGWEHLNFLGGTRHLSIGATPGVDLYPTRLDGTTTLAPTRALLENSIQAKLTQPSLFRGRIVGTLDASYNIKPLLYPLPSGTNPSEERIVGYQTVSTAAGLERQVFLPALFRDVPGRLTIAPSYNWQANFPFTYQKDLPAGLDNVRVAFPALVTTLDYRDDQVQTHEGFYVSNTLQVADKLFGGSVSDVKVQPEFRGYFPIKKHKITLASRVTLGFLIPKDYGKTLSNGLAGTKNPEDPEVVFDQEKLLLRAFYSGGLTSNRGYPLRGVGPHGPVGFLVPTGVNCSLGTGSAADLPPACIRPLGGFTLWEASLEVRFPLSGALSGVAFADASDVTRDVGHIRFSVPHLSIGPGIRYMTPVGPLRLDIGYRVPGAQAIGQSKLSLEEGGGDVSPLFGIDWLPLALNIGLNEAF